jgi:hypothetical protein
VAELPLILVRVPDAGTTRALTVTDPTTVEVSDTEQVPEIPVTQLAALRVPLPVMANVTVSSAKG